MLQLRRILCPVEYRERSWHALEHALALARQEEAVLTVLHVLPAPVLAGAGRAGPARDGPPGVDPEEERREDLRSLVGRDRVGDVRLELRIEQGNVPEEIGKQAAATHADLIVLEDHEWAEPGRPRLSGVADEVLRTATLPVLVVPPRCGPAEAFRRVICGLDLSPCNTVALQWAVALTAPSPAARLTLVHVLEGFPHQEVAAGRAGRDLGLYWRYREGLARTSLAELAAAHAGSSPTDIVVASGKPWLEILDLAAGRGADLIVVGRHGGGAPPGHFGRTAERLGCLAGCPVLTVPQE